MARIKLAYIGGGSTRAAGTMASFIERGDAFAGSEIVLLDLVPDRLALIERLSRRMAESKGVDLRVTSTTDRRQALSDCDAVLSSFRPGGFEARALDERIPLRFGIVGQETQGPGGFFMALRAIHVMKGIVADMVDVCPSALLVNYTNPVNIVAQAVSDHSEVPIVSLCEGPIYFPTILAHAAELDPELVDAPMAGLNHNCWSVSARYDGAELAPLVRDAWERRRDDPSLTPHQRRVLQLAAAMDAVPADYFQYYYFHDELLAEMQAKATTRAEDIVAWSPGYWQHYAEQAEAERPILDPSRSRGGIHELELAIDVIDALYNDRDEIHPLNLPGRGALPGFPDELVVEAQGRCSAAGMELLPQPPLAPQVSGLVKMLGEYQWLAAEAAWSGGRREAVRALASHPLIFELDTAERLYDAMAAAHRTYLPDRLLS